MRGDGLRSAVRSGRARAHTCALVLSLPDNDIFSRSVLKAGEPGLTLHSRCQTRLAARPGANSCVPRSQSGGARRDRTDDLMLAKHALYQLSYGPRRDAGRIRSSSAREVVGPGRLELPTLRLSGVRSNHLSYGPMAARPEVITLDWARDRAIDLTADSDWKERRRRRHPACF